MVTLWPVIESLNKPQMYQFEHVCHYKERACTLALEYSFGA
jgi:hypothetical protein